MANTLRGVQIAAESVFGSIVDGAISVGGLTWLTPEVEGISGLAFPFELEANERDEQRDHWGELPVEPATTWTGGTRRKHAAGGTISVTIIPRNFGAGVGDISEAVDLVLYQLLRTVMAERTTPAAWSDVVSAGVDTTNFTPTTLASFRDGDLILYEVDGKLQVSQVTDKAGGNVVHSPAATTGLTNQTVYLPQCVYQSRRGTGYSSSVAIRAEAQGRRRIYTGCRLESVTFRSQGGRLLADCTIRYVHAEPDDAAGAVTGGTNLANARPDNTGSSVPHTRGVHSAISAAVPASGPAEQATIKVNLQKDGPWEATFSWELQEVGHTDDMTGVANLEPISFSAEVTLNLDQLLATVTNDRRDQVQRTICLPAGPLGSGQGFAIFVPGGVLKSDPDALDFGGIIRTAPLVYGAGDAALCDTDNTADEDLGLVYIGFQGA